MKKKLLWPVVLIALVTMFAVPAGAQFGSSTNLLTNPSFEEGVNEHGWPVGWLGSARTKAGQEVRLEEASDAPNGEWVAVLHHSNDINASLHMRSHPPIPAAPGDIFSASASMKNSDGKTVLLVLVFLDKDGKEILQRNRSTSSREWVTVNTGNHTAPDEAAAVRVMFWQSRDAVGSTSYFDNVTLIKR